MMEIRVRCPDCGHVEVPAGKITLLLTPSGDQGAYGFDCPSCGRMVDTVANRTAVALLIAAGVEPVKTEEEFRGHVLEVEDLSPDPDAPPLTSDDVIAFHFLLEDDVAIAEEFALES